jgi:hypothetical protein
VGCDFATAEEAGSDLNLVSDMGEGRVSAIAVSYAQNSHNTQCGQGTMLDR